MTKEAWMEHGGAPLSNPVAIAEVLSFTVSLETLQIG